MAETVSNNGDIPDLVSLDLEDLTRPRFTPRELDMVKASTGKSLDELEGNDVFKVFAWLKLRRMGFTLDLDAMLDVVIELAPEIEVDPTTGLPRITLPSSVASGE
jgi:hypothetical protein